MVYERDINKSKSRSKSKLQRIYLTQLQVQAQMEILGQAQLQVQLQMMVSGSHNCNCDYNCIHLPHNCIQLQLHAAACISNNLPQPWLLISELLIFLPFMFGCETTSRCLH